jgi:hypothetical protein
VRPALALALEPELALRIALEPEFALALALGFALTLALALALGLAIVGDSCSGDGAGSVWVMRGLRRVFVASPLGRSDGGGFGVTADCCAGCAGTGRVQSAIQVE